jgi:hypothetical protein
MRYLIAAFVATTTLSLAFADDLKPVAIAGMKSTPPKEWKTKEAPATAMSRVATFALPMAEGDKEDAELIVFHFTSNAGSLDANLERQRALFLPAEGKDKVDEKKTEVKVGTIKATQQDLTGTFKKKPFPMSDKFTPMKDYRQLYVVFEDKEGQYFLKLLGPAKTVEKHKKSFDEWLAAFK